MWRSCRWGASPWSASRWASCPPDEQKRAARSSWRRWSGGWAGEVAAFQSGLADRGRWSGSIPRGHTAISPATSRRAPHRSGRWRLHERKRKREKISVLWPLKPKEKKRRNWFVCFHSHQSLKVVIISTAVAAWAPLMPSTCTALHSY